MNILIYNEKITKKDYQNFICTHKKVKENNRNESIPLTLFGKIILLRWHFKNKDIELYRNKIKRFFDSIDGLRDEFNSVMHSSKYNNYLDLPYNIRSILEDIIYILRWYEKYKKNSTN
jgi:hypothetical protein